MLIANLGPTEIIILLIVVLSLALPVVLILAVVFLLVSKRKSSQAAIKKCNSCGFTLPVDARVCQHCGR